MHAEIDAAILHLQLQGALQLAASLQQGLYASELLNQLLGRFLSHSGATWNIIHRIAHQAQHIDDLQGALQPPLAFYLLGPQNLSLALAHSGTVHPDAPGHELAVILVGCHHKGVYALLVSLSCQGTDYIVCLEARHLQDRDVVSLQDAFDIRHGKLYALGRFLTLRLILGIGLVAEGSARRVEGNAQMGGLLFLKHILERIDKA